MNHFSLFELLLKTIHPYSDFYLTMRECHPELTIIPCYLDSFWYSEMGKKNLEYKRLVIGEFLRLCVDKNSQIYKLKKTDSKELKKTIKLEAKLWSFIYYLIEDSRLFYNPVLRTFYQPDFLFYNIIAERKLCDFMCMKTSENMSATQLIKSIQRQNRQLEAMQNPFNISSEPCTHIFIESAILKAIQTDRFFKSLYSPMVHARMQLIQHIMTTRPMTYNRDGKITERRGRKPRK